MKEETSDRLFAILVILGVVSFIFYVCAGDGSKSRNSSPRPTPNSGNNVESLRRVYDAQGIRYDERMLREDARAIERLNREFGK